MKSIVKTTFVCAILAWQSMNASTPAPKSSASGSFGNDVRFVDSFTRLIVLSEPHSEALIAVSPSMQGRVLTSTASGWDGRSFGWVNRELIASGKIQQHFNAYGGEDRVWIGPEGGQFSVFFAAHQPFDLAHWFTPAALDTEPFDVVHRSRSSIDFRKLFTLTNYSDTNFSVQIDRKVRLLSSKEIWKYLNMPRVSSLKVVGFESVNKLTNAGTQAWKKQTGLLSIWILGQFQASPTTTIAIPIHAGPASELGKRVDSDYFGQIPPDRLLVDPNIIYFKADAHYRSKLGINPLRATGIFGSYDAQNHVLTLVQYTFPKEKSDYVNSAWKIQAHPYHGDSENAYNDGRQSPGGPRLGNFYELETSSPAAAIGPGQSIEHIHRTFHFEGNSEELDEVARKTLGVGLDAISNALPRR
ncbi:MAG: DUF6786 family protein [Acidobacteriaceae bacterium]